MQDPRIESGRPGLARFLSAPATWSDALLEDDDEPVKLTGPTRHHQESLTQLLASFVPDSNPNPTPDPGFYDGGVPLGLHRMSSFPAEFMSSNVDGYFSGFDVSVSNSYDFGGGGGGGGSPSGKRLKRRELTTANSLVEIEMEKLMEDSVACRVRAKRGCATHPRSIAERVRRTRISDRIRKLQELVPNMDKQTNTADMLEEAVEYVKTLQSQILGLTEQQKNCKCILTS